MTNYPSTNYPNCHNHNTETKKINNYPNNIENSMNNKPSSDYTNEIQNTTFNNMSNNLINNRFNNPIDDHPMNNSSNNLINSLLHEWNNTTHSFVNFTINESEIDNLLLELKTVLASYKCLNAYPDSLSEEVNNFLEMLDKNPKTVYFEAENINIYIACISSKIDSILINRSKSVANSINTISDQEEQMEDEGPEYVISVDEFSSDDELSDDEL